MTVARLRRLAVCAAVAVAAVAGGLAVSGSQRPAAPNAFGGFVVGSNPYGDVPATWWSPVAEPGSSSWQ